MLPLRGSPASSHRGLQLSSAPLTKLLAASEGRAASTWSSLGLAGTGHFPPAFHPSAAWRTISLITLELRLSPPCGDLAPLTG